MIIISFIYTKDTTLIEKLKAQGFLLIKETPSGFSVYDIKSENGYTFDINQYENLEDTWVSNKLTF